ncbi:hypothetical protein [Auraticoccus monumenti]|uniref:hypothetical protein n=1 Tax=Auraticoccus monumenti TaxID=675864 RepID=UPI0018D280A8|nr:hypothetical protein [Auraticoccus monumenti]
MALVEVKTGSNQLTAEQIENYLDVAREQGFDAVITISNEIPPAPGLHPTTVDRRKLRRVELHHWSWTEVLTQAVMQKEFRGVADPEQAWILGELIRYLEHPKSGAMSFDDMGADWVRVRDAVASGTLRPTDQSAGELASRFEALIRFACLRLGRNLGTEVVPVLTRQQVAEPQLRLNVVTAELVEHGVLRSQIRIPNAVSPMTVEADLRANKVTCSFSFEAPATGRPTTRVNWLVRQLKDAPDGLRVEAFVPRSRVGTAELLRDVREDATKLVADPQKEIKSFTVAQIQKLGTKRGVGRGSFIDSLLDSIDLTYGDVGQRLKAWSAAPPKLRSPEQIETEAEVKPELVSAALSSQDDEGPGSTA